MKQFQTALSLVLTTTTRDATVLFVHIRLSLACIDTHILYEARFINQAVDVDCLHAVEADCLHAVEADCLHACFSSECDSSLTVVMRVCLVATLIG